MDTRSGFLYKQGEIVQNWKKRWFVLKGSTLYYFKDEKTTYRPLGTILMPVYRIKLVTNKEFCPKPNAFVLLPRDKYERAYLIHAETESEMHDWLRELVKVSNEPRAKLAIPPLEKEETKDKISNPEGETPSKQEDNSLSKVVVPTKENEKGTLRKRQNLVSNHRMSEAKNNESSDTPSSNSSPSTPLTQSAELLPSLQEVQNPEESKKDKEEVKVSTPEEEKTSTVSASEKPTTSNVSMSSGKEEDKTTPSKQVDPASSENNSWNVNPRKSGVQVHLLNDRSIANIREEASLRIHYSETESEDESKGANPWETIDKVLQYVEEIEANTSRKNSTAELIPQNKETKIDQVSNPEETKKEEIKSPEQDDEIDISNVKINSDSEEDEKGLLAILSATKQFRSVAENIATRRGSNLNDMNLSAQTDNAAQLPESEVREESNPVGDVTNQEDRVIENVDGKNIAEFLDNDILQKLEEIEKEEEDKIKQEEEQAELKKKQEEAKRQEEERKNQEELTRKQEEEAKRQGEEYSKIEDKKETPNLEVTDQNNDSISSETSIKEDTKESASTDQIVNTEDSIKHVEKQEPLKEENIEDDINNKNQDSTNSELKDVQNETSQIHEKNTQELGTPQSEPQIEPKSQESAPNNEEIIFGKTEIVVDAPVHQEVTHEDSSKEPTPEIAPTEVKLRNSSEESNQVKSIPPIDPPSSPSIDRGTRCVLVYIQAKDKLLDPVRVPYYKESTLIELIQQSIPKNVVIPASVSELAIKVYDASKSIRMTIAENALSLNADHYLGDTLSLVLYKKSPTETCLQLPFYFTKSVTTGDLELTRNPTSAEDEDW